MMESGLIGAQSSAAVNRNSTLGLSLQGYLLASHQSLNKQLTSIRWHGRP
jgi:hypothetical protein